MLRALAILLFVCLALPLALSAAEARTWTDGQGRRIEAALIEVAGDQVTIVREDGRSFQVPISTFSAEDQQYVRHWSARQPIVLEPAKWPTKIQVRRPEITIVEEGGNSFVYRTESFEFRANVRLSRTLVSEFATIFEATFAALEALPLGLDVKRPPEGYFRTRLFSTAEEYREAGGLPGSVGLYNSQSGEIWCILENLGVRRSSSGFTFDRYADSGTLIHEITHQLMHDWRPRVPVWFFEGIAVYLESIPYERGSFQFQRQDVPHYFRRRTGDRASPAAILPIHELFGLNRRSWNDALGSSEANPSRRNYATAYLLTYYFFHLDGSGDAIRMRRFLHAAQQGSPAALDHLLDGRNAAQLEAEVVRAFNRQKLPVRPMAN